MRKLFLYVLISSAFFAYGQFKPTKIWHDKERELRYQPNGEYFTINNGDKRFTRAIYGNNSGFRFETSDFPEFGLYMPNLGGTVYMAISTPTKNVWISQLESIKSEFRSGQRIYTLRDKNILGNGELIINAVALADNDGLIVKYEGKNVPNDIKLIWIYGGASNKRFSREGDLGADPKDCFYLKPSNCKGNIFNIKDNSFILYYGQKSRPLSDTEAYENKGTYKPEINSQEIVANPTLAIKGIFPKTSDVRVVDGNNIDSLEKLIKSNSSDCPLVMAQNVITSKPFYFELHNYKDSVSFDYSDLSTLFEEGVKFRTEIASSIEINTPDSYINTLGGIYSGAEDAVWESPGYLHGAIGWRMPLTGWRAAYLADLMGKHDRARTHFNGYLNSQVTDVPVTLPPTQDKDLYLARAAKVWGTPMYSNGYICRMPNRKDVMHHYDMNLVFIDELLWHLNWTGDLDYAKKVFPVIKRHLAWEKNTFDPDNDGLYDGYCCIWASDALQYNGGKVTHSSAYNYRANKMMAEIAKLIGENPDPYNNEAELIISAINRELWIPAKGWWAEFKDNMGNGLLHESAALWSIYHSIDSDIHDNFKSYQATRYVDTQLPHIPVIAKGLKDTSNYVVATTNWQPYMWSINNVAFGEIMHTSLAYWQSGRGDEAFKMYKGAILDAMYLGSGPGNITQISFYDAARGEMYRDFADPVSMAVRALVQGMYGIIPDLMNNKLLIKPSFPSSWNFADIKTKNMEYSFKREGKTDRYEITPNLLKKNVNLILDVKSRGTYLKSVKVNNKNVNYTIDEQAILQPIIRIECGIADNYDIVIEWGDNTLIPENIDKQVVNGESINVNLKNEIVDVYDPQSILCYKKIENGTLTSIVKGEEGHRTIFVKVKEGEMLFWQPIDVNIMNPLKIESNEEYELLSFTITNNSNNVIDGELYLNGKKMKDKVKLNPNCSYTYNLNSPYATLGTNIIDVKGKSNKYSLSVINWNVKNNPNIVYRTIDFSNKLNDKITNIFQYDKYLTPRYKYTTLQVPTQGMGQWCHPKDLSVIDDSGLRIAAMKNDNIYRMPQGIPFLTNGDSTKNNILFTTLWDNYPSNVDIPLNGKASKAYFLVAASTYHMQADIINGKLKVFYKDGTQEVLDLVLPDNLLPLDQDIFIDGWAFNCKQPRPWRVRLKTGDVSKNHAYTLNKTISNNPIYIEGGMCTMLDLPLNPKKELKSLTLETIANEVIIGLMSVTLVE